ncbi:exodeoxyribonuclease VII small subunit [Propionibacterium freudenreichii]|uniref:exodeoxyribonuclease VII small subunit n=1 Tax=Propionibacterium freudenreichii TaxID=1744 RepID=UPI000BC32EB5|nr:exodeoxyribonuclease VII small subunit [Propionibacterium freudenreichii]MDK9294480.1 exodeoxyribonuclease VII small subunit [Propionibacterium freudenreichii]MDK9359810.1 exodeoxyribonuclease VII small subunit [Propionibacterium freudenreichii]MDK9638787.1 exodeoxyribonuclease VII small subunit [Propionibacterium freudenreichii]WGU90879.1 exodeoxyribonuclease VII small subunit [Propionibacterium freudenreichii]SCQ71458.1 Exodeoxyribonuclease 7 small subunit [Propionibacterium freudenreichi
MAADEQPELSYEQARAELADVVTKLESGGVPLADSMQLWQRGEKLARICQGWLDGARATIDKARQADQAASDAGEIADDE